MNGVQVSLSVCVVIFVMLYYCVVFHKYFPVEILVAQSGLSDPLPSYSHFRILEEETKIL